MILKCILNHFLDFNIQYFVLIFGFMKKYNLTNSRFLKVLNCNIRSIRCNYDEFFLFLHNDIHGRNKDIIVLTESWHDVNYCDFVNTRL